MEPLRVQDIGLQRMKQGIEGCNASADPVAQCRGVDLDALAGIGRALTVQRLMQQKLGDQHHSQQAGTGKAARNGMRRCWCLCNAFAIATGEFFAHMLDDLPFARFTFQRSFRQRSGGIFSELA